MAGLICTILTNRGGIESLFAVPSYKETVSSGEGMIESAMAPPPQKRWPDRPSSSIEDAAILAEVARSDFRRFDVLVDRYKVRLTAYLGHRVPDRHHAEDLAQEAFLRMFRAARMGGYSGRAAVFSTWLFTIADNCATDYLRASGRQPLALESDMAADPGDARAGAIDRFPSADIDPADAAAHRESQGRADALLASLPEEQRRVVALKILGGLTLSEVAAVVGCPVGTVKSRLLYGLRKIEALVTRNRRQQP
jgi:RNA polymerase sigma-70 factor (ECF subfamily)